MMKPDIKLGAFIVVLVAAVGSSVSPGSAAAQNRLAAPAKDASIPGAPQRQPLSGADIYQKTCAACHAPGPEHSGTFQLTVTRGPAQAVLTSRNDLTSALVDAVVRHGQNAMPAFPPSEITDSELHRLAAFLVKTPAKKQ